MRVLAISILGAALASAQNIPPASCSPPTTAQLAKSTDYVGKRYARAGSLILLEAGRANSACFWKLRYRFPNSARELLLYLSPDRGYVTPLLYDVHSDPAAEITERAKETRQALLSGSPPSQGNASVPVAIVEFADFECPYCARMHQMLLQVLSEKSDVRLVYRNFPLSMHPWAKRAAEMAVCAGFQNHTLFWKAHDYLFDHQTILSATNIDASLSGYLAQQSSFNKDQFASCMSHELSLGLVTQDEDLGRRLGVHGTPTIFVNGERLPGVRTVAQLEKSIEAVQNGKPLPVPTVQQALIAPTCAVPRNRPVTASEGMHP